MHWNYGPMGFGWLDWLLVVIVLLVFLGGLAAVVLTAVRRPHSTTPCPDPGSPFEVLAGRFARGEIDDEEYRRRRDTLREIK